MNRRIKNKRNKRHGFFHYRDYVDDIVFASMFEFALQEGANSIYIIGKNPKRIHQIIAYHDQVLADKDDCLVRIESRYRSVTKEVPKEVMEIIQENIKDYVLIYAHCVRFLNEIFEKKGE